LTTEKRPNEWRPVIRAALIGVTLFGLDAVCSGQGFFAVLVAFVAIVVQVGLAIRNAVNGRWRPVTRHLAACGVYALSFLLVWTYILTDRDGAARRAEKLITACHAYEAKYGRYPEHLGELVPEFVDRIPRPAAIPLGRAALVGPGLKFVNRSSSDGFKDGKTRGPRYGSVHEITAPEAKTTSPLYG
jgi:hypothetical protein